MTDEHEGQGGSYVIGDDGARKLVERTRESGDEPPTAAPSGPPAPTEVTTQDQPADAGFFSPVAPADKSTTSE